MEQKTRLSRKPGTRKSRTPPDRERGPNAGSEALRRFFGSAQPTEESSSAPGRVNPTGQTRTSTFRKLSRLQNVNTSTSGSGPTGNPERLPLSVLNSPEPVSRLAFGKAASRPVKPGGGSPGRYTPRLTTRPVFGKALSGAKARLRKRAFPQVEKTPIKSDVYRGLPFVSRQSLW